MSHEEGTCSAADATLTPKLSQKVCSVLLLCSSKTREMSKLCGVELFTDPITVNNPQHGFPLA